MKNNNIRRKKNKILLVKKLIFFKIMNMVMNMAVMVRISKIMKFKVVLIQGLIKNFVFSVSIDLSLN